MHATLIYDGKCSLCRKAVEWVQRHERPGALAYLACQSPERAAQFPDITESQCMQAMQLVLDDGTVYAGDKALPHLFLMLQRWRWVAKLFRLPGVSILAPIAYHIIAKNRYIFSVIVARKHQPAKPERQPDSADG